MEIPSSWGCLYFNLMDAVLFDIYSEKSTDTK